MAYNEKAIRRKCINGGWCQVIGKYVEHQRIKECKDYEDDLKLF